MSQLPLQIRKDIRDFYDKEDAPVQESIKKLADVIGYPVSCDIEWQMLWAEFESTYSDKAIFVPTIADVVTTWCDTLAVRLEDDKFESWTEEFLGKIEAVRAVKLFIQVSDESRPKTSWADKRRAFIISLPKKSISPPRSAGSGFETDFATLFEPQKPSTKLEESQSLKDDDDWANVESAADSKSVSVRVREPEMEVPDVLPSLQTLPRPDILFRTLTPYLIQVSSMGANSVTVTATHEPSLRLLAEYFQRWIKNDPQDVRKIPYLRIKLVESNFGLGLFYDTLTIEPFDHHQRHAVVNVVLILAFIEGVLGYHPMPDTSGSGHWEFRRTTPFRS